jgi:multicomponent Na+:H+ antiporter subunit D
MWMLEIPPYLPFFIGALIAAVSRGTLRNVFMVATPIVSALHLWMVPEGIHLQFAFLDYQLTPYRVDKLSLMFGYVFHIAAFIAIIYSLHVRELR